MAKAASIRRFAAYEPRSGFLLLNDLNGTRFAQLLSIRVLLILKVRALMIPNLTKDMIDIMQQLRKRLRSEFGVELKLSQPDIVQNILELVNKSHDQRTLLLFADLEDMMGIQLMARSETVENSQASAKRMYRGQAIPDSGSPAMAADTRPKRIYRGQVVA